MLHLIGDALEDAQEALEASHGPRGLSRTCTDRLVESRNAHVARIHVITRCAMQQALRNTDSHPDMSKALRLP